MAFWARQISLFSFLRAVTQSLNTDFNLVHSIQSLELCIHYGRSLQRMPSALERHYL